MSFVDHFGQSACIEESSMSQLNRMRWVRGMLSAAIMLALCCATATLQAADDTTSLSFIPANAAFYSTNLRIKEQIDIVAKSNAWARVKSMPALKTFWE